MHCTLATRVVKAGIQMLYSDIHLAGKRCPWLTESCQVKKETVVSTVSTTDKFTIMYSNVDNLPNKKQELVAFINNAPCKPKLIALTEIKHKK